MKTTCLAAILLTAWLSGCVGPEEADEPMVWPSEGGQLQVVAMSSEHAAPEEPIHPFIRQVRIIVPKQTLDADDAFLRVHIVVEDRGHDEPFDGEDWLFNLSVDENHLHHNGTATPQDDWLRKYRLQAVPNATTIHTTTYNLGPLSGNVIMLRMDYVNVYPNGEWKALKTSITIRNDGKGYETYFGQPRGVCASDSNVTCPWHTETERGPPIIPDNLPVYSPEPAVRPVQFSAGPAHGFPPPGVTSGIFVGIPRQVIDAANPILTLSIYVVDLGVPFDGEDWVFRLRVDEANQGTIVPPEDADWYRKHSLQWAPNATVLHEVTFDLGEISGSLLKLRLDYHNLEPSGQWEAWSDEILIVHDRGNYLAKATNHFVCHSSDETTVCPWYEKHGWGPPPDALS